jgi:hypothetical protein
VSTIIQWNRKVFSGSRKRKVGKLQKINLRITTLLFAVVLPYSVFVWLTLDHFGLSPLGSYCNYAIVVLTALVTVIPLFYLFNIVVHRRPDRPLITFLRDIRGEFNPERLLSRLTPAILLTLLLGSFTAFKTLISVLNPFQYDQLFMELDRAVFFGVDPWRITHAVFDGTISSWILQQFYIYWYVLMWVSLVFVTFRADLRRLRTHYLVAFSLSFILVGTVGALFMSSAGPCYYGWITGEPDVFAPLMERLHTLDTELRAMTPPRSLSALLLQDYLREAYESGAIVLGGGISAMPSMHIAVAVLLAQAGYTYKRWTGHLLSPFVVVIWIGSIHLGWHYAVDGLVSLFLTIAIWNLSGWVVERLDIRDNTAEAGHAMAHPPLVIAE